MKKTLLITLFVVIIAALVGGYIFFNKKAKAKKEAQPEKDQNSDNEVATASAYNATADAAKIREQLKALFPNSAIVTEIIYKLSKPNLKALTVAYKAKYGISLLADLNSQTGVPNLQIAADYVRINS